jgi:hypothetical protein
VVIWLLWSALAHEPGGCPPVSLFERRAQQGQLDEAGRDCLAEVADVHAGWLLWTDRVVRGGDPAFGDLLARTEDPDDALAAAELVKDPALAREALQRALELSDRWETAVVRSDRLPRVDAVITRCDPRRELAWNAVLPPAAPTPDDLLAANDLGVVYAHALWGKAYATERDAVLRAAEAAEGPGRHALARLALLLAEARADDPESAIVASAARSLLPGSAAPGLVSDDRRGEGE